MSSKFGLASANNPGAPSPIDLYKQARASGKSLVAKLWEFSRASKFDMIKAARKLTVPMHERTLILDSETDMSALSDFFLHEMRYQGKRIIDSCDPGQLGLTEGERKILEGYRAAHTSFFEMVAVRRNDCRIELRDLLDASRPRVFLTDINLSESLLGPGMPAVDFFLRVNSCHGLQFSSGLFFSFLRAHRIYLLNALAARMQTVKAEERSQRTFIFFYQQQRRIGTQQAYQDV